jgi:hypothetical protein
MAEGDDYILDYEEINPEASEELKHGTTTQAKQ